MKTSNLRQLVFGTMIAAIAVFGVVYAGSSGPWANFAFAEAVMTSTPAQPLNLRETGSTPTEVTLAWDNGADYRPDKETFTILQDGSVVATTTATEVVVGALVPGSTHGWTVTATRFGATSAPSVVANITQVMTITPAQPLNLRETGSTPTQVTLAWDNGADYRPDKETFTILQDGSVVATTTATEVVVGALIPGSTHGWTVTATRFGATSAPSVVANITQVKANTTLGKPRVPSSAKRTSTIKVTGAVSSSVDAYPVSESTKVTLRFYRRHRNASGALIWGAPRKTLTALRPGTGSYSKSTKLSPAGTWSVVAYTAGDGQHRSDSSVRSNSMKIK
ncbi:MAG: hypothetical protein HGB10_11320 [Coriobacteriia bacterium]|nr:hypothetical protein [Coriobacteriia bacterium]